MKIGKFVRMGDGDFVYDGNFIYEIIENKAQHPYWLNNFCMYEIIQITNKSNNEIKQYARLISWDHKYDTETGKLKTI